jgi:sugar phosphate permease
MLATNGSFVVKTTVDTDTGKPDWSLVVAISAMFLVGLAIVGYLNYKAYHALGGIRGWFVYVGRIFAQLLLVLATFAAYLGCFAAST